MRMPHKIMIRCSCCRGTGNIELPRHLWLTLRAVGTDGDATIPSVHRKLVGDEPWLKVTAVNNRVRELERLGLVNKVGKRDKAFLWRGIRWPS